MDLTAFSHQHAPLPVFAILNISTAIFIQPPTLKSETLVQASISLSPNF